MFLPGMKAPGGTNTPFMPARAFGAPHTTCTGSPVPVSTMHTRSRSAFGCCFASNHARDDVRRQQRRLVLDALDLEPDHGELVDDLVERAIGVEMLLEPGEGEFHHGVPALAASLPLLAAVAACLPPPCGGGLGRGLLDSPIAAAITVHDTIRILHHLRRLAEAQYRKALRCQAKHRVARRATRERHRQSRWPAVDLDRISYRAVAKRNPRCNGPLESAGENRRRSAVCARELLHNNLLGLASNPVRNVAARVARVDRFHAPPSLLHKFVGHRSR